MNFGDALEELKQGARIQRANWNGKGMWIALSPGKLSNPVANFWSEAVRNFGIRNHLPSINVRPYIVMYTADGEIVPWVASQTDILETDWQLLGHDS